MLGTDSHIKTRTKVSHNSMKSPHFSARPCGMRKTCIATETFNSPPIESEREKQVTEKIKLFSCDKWANECVCGHK